MKKLLQVSLLFLASLLGVEIARANGTLVVTSFPSGADITVDGVTPAIPE